MNVRVRVPRPRRRAPRRGQAGPHRRHVPARAATTSTACCSSTGCSDPTHAHDLGAVRALPPRRVRRADHRVRRARRVVTSRDATGASCAWLGGDGRRRRRAASRSTADRITAVTPGVPPPPPGAHRLAGPDPARASPTPTRHAFHRALRGRTHGGTRLVLDLARADVRARRPRSTPTRYHRAGHGHVRRDGAGRASRAVGEFHYLHHGPGGRPYADPNAMGDALVAAAAEAGIRITLLDTCYLHGGIGRAARTTRSGGSATATPSAWAAAASARAASAADRAARRRHPLRAGRRPPDEMADRRARGPTSEAAPLHAHVSEQPAENEDVPGRVRPHADRGARRRRRARPAVHRRPRHPPHRPTTSSCLGAAGSRCCLCPTTERDLADGIGPAGRARRGGRRAVPRVATPTRSSTCSRRRGRSSSTSGSPPGARGHHRAADLLTAATAGGTRRLGWPDAGRARGRRAGRPRHRRRLDSVRLAGAAPEHAARRRRVRGRRAPTCATSSSAARRSCATACTSALDVPAASCAAIDRGGAAVTHARRRPHRPARHQRSRRSATARSGWCRDAAVVVEDGRVVAVGAAGSAIADERLDAGGPLRDPRLRRQPHPPGVRRRPGRRVRRPHGRPALRGRRHPRHDGRGDPRRARRRAAALARGGGCAEARPRGTTHVEIKSGYGLDVDERGRAACDVAGRAHRRHHVPRRPRRARPSSTAGPTTTSTLVVRRRCSTPARRWRRWVDVFCEVGAFDADQSPRRAQAAAAAGLGLRLHANQLGPGPGVQLAVELGAASADHCTYLDRRRHRRARRRATTVATLLPATDFSTRQPYPDARRLLDAGATVALATQLQPGLELHDLDAVLHRPRRPRDAHDGRRGAAGGHRRRRRRAAPRRPRPPRARARRRRRRARRAVAPRTSPTAPACRSSPRSSPPDRRSRH